MKILIVSPNIGLPTNNGARRRIYHSILELSKFHEITLVALLQDQREQSYVKELESVCENIHTTLWQKKPKHIVALESIVTMEPYRVRRFKNSIMRKIIFEELETKEYDVIWVFFLELLAYIPLQALNQKQWKILVDYHNDDLCFWRRISANADSLFQRLYAWINVVYLKRFIRIYKHYIDIGLAVSQEDYETLSRWKTSESKLWIAPNGVDLKYFSGSREPAENPVILFCGALDMEMNVSAVRNFIEDIFYEVRKEITDCQFWIVGRDPDHRVLQYRDMPGIKIFPSVPDVRPYYQKAWVVVSPYNLGGGSKLKVIEAMAMRVPVVSTTIGCQGIDCDEKKKEIVVADTNQQFTMQMIRLIRNPKLRQEIAKNGRLLVEKKYGWRSIYQDLTDKLLEV